MPLLAWDRMGPQHLQQSPAGAGPSPPPQAALPLVNAPQSIILRDLGNRISFNALHRFLYIDQLFEGVTWDFLFLEVSDISYMCVPVLPFLFLPAAWKTDMVAGTGATNLDHKVTFENKVMDYWSSSWNKGFLSFWGQGYSTNWPVYFQRLKWERKNFLSHLNHCYFGVCTSPLNQVPLISFSFVCT